MQQALAMQAYGLAVGICVEAMQGGGSNATQNQNSVVSGNGLSAGAAGPAGGAYPWTYSQPKQ